HTPRGLCSKLRHKRASAEGVHEACAPAVCSAAGEDWGLSVPKTPASLAGAISRRWGLWAMNAEPAWERDDTRSAVWPKPDYHGAARSRKGRSSERPGVYFTPRS